MNKLMEKLDVDNIHEAGDEDEKIEKKTDFFIQNLAITASELKSD